MKRSWKRKSWQKYRRYKRRKKRNNKGSKKAKSNIKESKYVSPVQKYDEIKSKYATTYNVYNKGFKENKNENNINKVNTNSFEKNNINKNIVNIKETPEKKISNITYTKFKQTETKKELEKPSLNINNINTVSNINKSQPKIIKEKKIKEINIPKEISNNYIIQTEMPKNLEITKKPEKSIRTQYISANQKNISSQISKSTVNITETSYKIKTKIKNELPLVKHKKEKTFEDESIIKERIKSRYSIKEREKETELIDYEIKMARERARKEMEDNERKEQYKINKEKKNFEIKLYIVSFFRDFLEIII